MDVMYNLNFSKCYEANQISIHDWQYNCFHLARCGEVIFLADLASDICSEPRISRNYLRKKQTHLDHIQRNVRYIS